MNTVIWFQLGSFTDPVSGQIATGDIARFLAGDPTAGVYTAGFLSNNDVWFTKLHV